MKADRWKRFWTPEEEANLVAWFNEGYTAEQIARALGRSRHGVMRRRQELQDGLQRYSPKRLWTPQEDAQLIVMLNAGQPPRAVARALGRSISSVHTRTDVLRDRQAPLPPTRREVARDRAPPPILPEDPCPFITNEDRAWMNYWRQPRAVRQGLPSGVSP
jgi:DNA-binding CsgD family transcriptional regulator